MGLTKKTYEVVADDIERKIRSGTFKPGDRLETIERQADFYHVARSTIREALGLLRAKGLVETIQGDGTFVATDMNTLLNESQDIISVSSELKHVLEVRRILELGAISLAVQNRTEDDVKALRHIVQQMQSALGNEDLSQLYDAKFHAGISVATHNPLVEKMMTSVMASISKTIQEIRRFWMQYEEGSFQALLEEHKAILDAIEQQDEERAIQLLSHHLEKPRESFISL